MPDPRLIQILRTPPSPAAPEAPVSTAAGWPAVTERLREFAASRERPSLERCEFCGAGIDDDHGHVVDLPRRALLCVCRPCYLLFTHDGAGGRRFRAVPTRYAFLPDMTAVGDLLDALRIPIGLAFVFTSSAAGRTTAFYPSPAGAIESELPLEAWDDVLRMVPSVATMSPDVEALLVRQTDDRVDALIVPIDAAYELVGRVRRHWEGMQGGDELRRDIDDFFVGARARAERGAP